MARTIIELSNGSRVETSATIDETLHKIDNCAADEISYFAIRDKTGTLIYIFIAHVVSVRQPE